ncbi:helix-turn-helix domain-containing protein [Billgrantia aerodenitrificans]|uniref:ImmA/IrrE family metallo-endopeptidase n=1 Tax=Billgrantia aerodenitrificans TaxID=2733483 RepID=A0ABS9AZM0_9GAMM|nr:XRE family transcriptional regulator [Halomonas aerodenitrificans]MCE8027067.1 ImmA/IrrE family metallo-endopeptidase [Halomonas aerodenitrificans]
MSIEHISINLRRLRKESGISQAELAEAAGLSLSGYRKLELAKTESPRPESLKSIARVLGVPLQELLMPVASLEQVRFRSLRRLKSRGQILADVAVWLQDFADLEDLTGERPPHALEPLWKAYHQHGAEDIPGYAQRVRSAFHLNDREPVHDICGLLEARGIKVRSVSVPNDAFMGLSVGTEERGGPAIVVNTWERLPVETWIFSAVHELGHLLMHLGAYDVAASEEDADQEREADRFASHFLMPEAAFRREWDETAGLSLLDRVFKVKRVFRVSWRTVLFRVAESMPEASRGGLWARFNAEYKRQRSRSLLKHDEPSGIDAEVYHALYSERPVGEEPFGMDAYDFKEDRLARLVRRGLEEGLISLSRGSEILNLPLIEMRELTRSWMS